MSSSIPELSFEAIEKGDSISISILKAALEEHDRALKMVRRDVLERLPAQETLGLQVSNSDGLQMTSMIRVRPRAGVQCSHIHLRRTHENKNGCRTGGTVGRKTERRRRERVAVGGRT